jgi:predicted RNase H-like nuclease
MSGFEWTLVGIDCATEEERMGLARGRLDRTGRLTIERVTLGTAGESAAASVSQWLASEGHYLVAFDAPLGWPSRLSKALARHRAGEALPLQPDELFRRQTDRLVHRELGKRPPEVGADRIARTGLAALSLLAEVRKLSERPLPMAWKQAEDSGVIEVFPAATLLARQLTGVYRARSASGRKARRELLDRLESELALGTTREVMVEDPNQFDAMLCVLAGADYARGLCVEPTDRALAELEGFIWFRSSGQRLLFGALDKPGAPDGS